VTEEASFGVIPLSKLKGVWRIFLIQHKRGRHWGFPKGHAEVLETSERAAMRELKEETNLDIIRFLSQEPLRESYQLMRRGQPVLKRVLYFVAEVDGVVQLQKEEIMDGAWFSLSEARNRLTHSEGKEILKQVEQLLLNL
jgi:bis(5'-nucleosidyl)-tetraphosphatase